MKKILTALVAIAIIAGAYFWSFGVPDALSITATSDTAAPQAPGGQGGQGGPRRGGGGGATTVVLTPLELHPYEDVFRAVGSSEAVSSAIVSADVSGRIVAVNLAANTEVTQGDILVELDARAATLTLQIAENELVQASDTVTRYERLQQTGNSTVSGVASAEAGLALRLAEANVELAQLELDDRTVRANISGTLGLSDVNVGDTISAGSAIVTIDNSSALTVEFELPERSIGLLSVGREVLLNTPSFVGRVFSGQIASFDSRIDSVTRSVTVKARVENPDALLWPGMTFSVRVLNESAPLAMLPSTALTWSRDGSSIWMDRDGAAAAVPVTILYRRDEQVWLDVDIPIGTMVVTEGAQKLREGAAITDANAAPRRPRTPAADGPQVRTPATREDAT